MAIKGKFKSDLSKFISEGYNGLLDGKKPLEWFDSLDSGNMVGGYIGVEESGIGKMVELGYEHYEHPDGQKGYFKPKYDRLL